MMLDKTVRITDGTPELNRVLEREFSRRKYVLLDEGSEEKATVGVIGFSRKPGRRPLLTNSNSLYPIVWCATLLNGKFMQDSYAEGAYRCLSPRDFSSDGEFASSVVQAAEDILAMAELLGECEVGSGGATAQAHTKLFDLLGVGLSVIDKGFRIWYRNKIHEEMVGSRASSPLCWVCYHNRPDQIEPCQFCPARALHEQERFEETSVYVGVGCGRHDDRTPRLLRVRTVPILHRGRAVGAIEEVYDATEEVAQAQEADFEKAVAGVMRSAFLADFVRARLFILTPEGEKLRGAYSVGVPPLPCNVESLIVSVHPSAGTGTGESPTLPSEPRIRYKDDLDESEMEWAEEIDKERAPFWADLPIRDPGGKIMGKVVVDRWHQRGVKSKSLIGKEELPGYENALGLLGRLMAKSKEYRETIDRFKLASGFESLLQTAHASSQEVAFDALMKTVAGQSDVVSVILREPTRQGKDTHLRWVRGSGIYSEWCAPEIPIDGTIAGEAFKKRTQSVVMYTTYAGKSSLRLSRPFADIPAKQQNELLTVACQCSYAIGALGRDPLAVLSVQARSPECLNSSVPMLVELTRAVLSSQASTDLGLSLERCLVSLLELHDIDTAEHSELVGEISRAIAEQMVLTADLPEQLPARAFLAGCLHDIGKVGLSQSLVRGHTRLTAGEWAHVRAHVDLGGQILGNMPELSDICRAAADHHRWYDGSQGYPLPPNGAKLETPEELEEWQSSFSLLGRIVAVADCFEAMTSPTRYYQKPAELTEGREYVEAEKGKRFAEDVVDAFVVAYGRIDRLIRDYRTHTRKPY